LGKRDFFKLNKKKKNVWHLATTKKFVGHFEFILIFFILHYKINKISWHIIDIRNTLPRKFGNLYKQKTGIGHNIKIPYKIGQSLKLN
jgi:hypothetical protein